MGHLARGQVAVEAWSTAPAGGLAPDDPRHTVTTTFPRA